MKTISNLNQYKNELSHIFQQTKEVGILLESIKNLFLKVLKPYPYMNSPELKLISTDSLKFSVWYQDPNAITETLNIHQTECDLYLWRCADQKWYLNDLYNNPEEISMMLLDGIPCFKCIPENPREVQDLLKNKLMHFDLDKFPIFSEKAPLDKREVLTWDDRFILVGTHVENLKIYSHREWGDLIQRENYFKYNDG